MHWEFHEIRYFSWKPLEKQPKNQEFRFSISFPSTSLERNHQDLDHAFSLAKAAGAFITPEVANDFVVAISTTGREGGNFGIVAWAWGAWNRWKMVEGCPKTLILMDKLYLRWKIITICLIHIWYTCHLDSFGMNGPIIQTPSNLL